MLFQSSDSTLFPIAHGASACVHIIDFVIAPEWRNRGLGSTVLAALKKYAAANSALLRLSVDRQNVQAKRLYVRHGFVERQVTDTHEQLFWAAINE